MRVFMSMPMNGKTDEEIEARKTELIPTFAFPVGEFLDGRSDEPSPIRGLAHALTVLDDCDAIWMTPGWEDSVGCKIERAVAEAYDIPVYD